MKRQARILVTAGMLACLVTAHPEAKAQIPIVSLVTSAIKKVIVALDLKVQQLQNQTIMLQNEEQALENKMSLGNLNDISGWLDKEKQLYAGYYQELQQVKSAISDYEVVKQVISQQGQLLSEYKKAYSLFRQDRNFSPAEIGYMGQVYNGILAESAQNLDGALLAVSASGASMSDGERLELIHKAAGNLQRNLNDLRQFNANGVQASLARAAEHNNLAQVKQLYGL